MFIVQPHINAPVCVAWSCEVLFVSIHMQRCGTEPESSTEQQRSPGPHIVLLLFFQQKMNGLAILLSRKLKSIKRTMELK